MRRKRKDAARRRSGQLYPAAGAIAPRKGAIGQDQRIAVEGDRGTGCSRCGAKAERQADQPGARGKRA